MQIGVDFNTEYDRRRHPRLDRWDWESMPKTRHSEAKHAMDHQRLSDCYSVAG
jgi:hypothetical protein